MNASRFMKSPCLQRTGLDPDRVGGGVPIRHPHRRRPGGRGISARSAISLSWRLCWREQGCTVWRPIPAAVIRSIGPIPVSAGRGDWRDDRRHGIVCQLRRIESPFDATGFLAANWVMALTAAVPAAFSDPRAGVGSAGSGGPGVGFPAPCALCWQPGGSVWALAVCCFILSVMRRISFTPPGTPRVRIPTGIGITAAGSPYKTGGEAL